MTTETDYSPDPDNIMSVALGPQHPGAGHFRIRLWLDGDYVVRADPDPGYVHRGEEKMAEYRNYIQNVPHLERPAILDSSGILFPYAEAVDELMGNKVPVRAQYLPRHHGRAQPHNLPHVLPEHLRGLRGAHDDDHLGAGRQGPLHRPRRER